jgi:hypothetical protein
MDVAEYDAARVRFGEAERMLGDLPAPHLRRVLLTNMGQLALEIGEPGLARKYFSTSLATETVSPWEAHRCTALAGLALSHLFDGHLIEARDIAERLPGKPDPWTFDPVMWISLEAKLASVAGRPIQEIATMIREMEEQLQTRMLLPWMRLRVLRLELGLRRGLAVGREDVQELLSFTMDRCLPARHREVQRFLKANDS